MPAVTPEFINSLKRFVNLEYDTQARQIQELWQQPLAARVAEGEAITGIEVIEARMDRAVLRCTDNLSKFRTPDALRLHKGDPASDLAFNCTLDEERGNGLVILPGYGEIFEGLRPGSDANWILDRAVVDVRHILIQALDALAASKSRSAEILGMFEGTYLPSFDSQREADAEKLAVGLGGNQREAFIRAYSTQNYYLIQGPPGTGKTWVLAHLATALAKSGERVLITAFTHRAINNALLKIARTTKYDRLMKIGERGYADDLTGIVPNYEKFTDSPYALDLLKPDVPGLIIGATSFSARSKRLKDIPFDTIIFDEAGQVTLPLAIAGMLSGKRFIFIGDHQQMSPVITAEHPQEWVTQSVFETLFNHAPGTMLDVTYRMNAEINQFPSSRFYGGKLRSADDSASQRLILSRPPERFAELLDPNEPCVFVEIPHTNRQMRSPEEAEIAAGIAAEALACGIPPQEIAIVAPYRAQGRLIRQQLFSQLGTSNPAWEQIVVDTVERIQGQERDLVIISLTTSDPAHAAAVANFYFQPNRLNVAITRPRVKRIVLGSPTLFEANPKDAKYAAWVENFRALYQESKIIHINL